MTQDEIDTILQQRQRGVRMHAQPGDTFTRSGWARREIEAIDGWRDLGRGNPPALSAALCAHWPPIWAAETEARRKRAEQTQAEAEAREQSRRWQACGVPLRFSQASWGDWPDTDKVARQVFWHPHIPEGGRRYFNLMLWGDTGRGKTRLAAAWLRDRCLGSGDTVAFIAADALAREIVAARDRSSVIAKYTLYDAMVLDDLAANVGNSIDVALRHLGALEQLIEARNSEERPTAFTTNASPTDLETNSVFTPRALSRIFDQALVLEVTGDDRRALQPNRNQQ